MKSTETSPEFLLMQALSQNAPLPPTRRLRVLHVEDAEIDRNVIRWYITEQKLNYEMVEAVTLEQARNRLAGGVYDVLILDNKLPDGFGMDFLQETGETPVVFVTGANDLALAVRAIRAGAADYLVKDVQNGYLKMLPVAIERALSERRVRALLKQSQQLCHQVFDEAPLGKLLVAPNGRVLKVNRATGRLLGYPETDWLVGGLEAVLSPVDFADYRDRLGGLVAGKEPAFKIEKPVQHYLGASMQVQFHVSLVRDETGRPLVGVVQLHDFTEFRMLEGALRTSEAQLRAQFEAIPAAVFVSDATGLITGFNPQTAVLWGRQPLLRDPADRFCQSLKLRGPDGGLVPPEQSWMAVALAERRLVGDQELVVEFADGRRRHLLAYASPIVDSTGTLTGAINILVDVTEPKRLEHRQRLLEEQLNRARKLEAIGTLAGGVAHEFNNLLTAILGHLQLAEFDVEPGHAARPCLGHAIDSCRNARDLVRRLVKFSEQSAGSYELTPLGTIVADTVEAMKAVLPIGSEITTNLENQAGPVVFCSAGEIREALLQLATNAGQAMRGGCGVLEIALTHAVPSPEWRERYPQVGAHQQICLSMKDTGVGMSPAVLARLFEPFYTTKAPGEGAGLGLAGVYGIMKRHRGAVVVESEPEIGTTVRLYFPEGGFAGP